MSPEKPQNPPETTGEQPIPGTPRDLLRGIFEHPWLKKHRFLRALIYSLVGLATIAGTVLTILPEKHKERVFDYLFDGGTNAEKSVLPAKPPEPSRDSTQPSAPPPAALTRPTLIRPATRGRLADPKVLAELRAKSLLEKLDEAERYAKTGSAGQEEALRRYRDVVSRLSPSAVNKLDPALRSRAEKAYQEGHNDDALATYRALFVEYIKQTR